MIKIGKLIKKYLLKVWWYKSAYVEFTRENSFDLCSGLEKHWIGRLSHVFLERRWVGLAVFCKVIASHKPFATYLTHISFFASVCPIVSCKFIRSGKFLFASIPSALKRSFSSVRSKVCFEVTTLTISFTAAIIMAGMNLLDSFTLRSSRSFSPGLFCLHFSSVARRCGVNVLGIQSMRNSISFLTSAMTEAFFFWITEQVLLGNHRWIRRREYGLCIQAIALLIQRH